MTKETLISIIVPCYKVEKYLKKCVDSLISQTYTNLEIILVDDGSPDNTGNMCDELSKSDNRIKVLHKKNGGLADARNAAIDIAQGEWLTFIDSDDYVSNDYVETLYNLVSENNCLVGVSNYQTFFEGEEPKTQYDNIETVCLNKTDAVNLMFYQEKIETIACAKIYHKSLFNTGIRYPYGLIYEDLPTTYRYFLKSDKIAITNKVTYFYLLRKDSLEGQKFNPKKFESGLKILQMIREDAELAAIAEDATRCRLFSFCLHILLEMPDDYNDDRRVILEKYVKDNRLKVLFNSRARKKARIAALISFAGRSVMKKTLSLVKQRKYD